MFVLSLVVLTGCRESPEMAYVSSAQVQALEPEIQRELRSELRSRVGTFENPELLSRDPRSQIRLEQGQAVYELRCVQCHGTSGDGNGRMAQVLYPRPRDYRRGIFKFTSTPYGLRPARADLIRTIRNGVRGTSMPEFKLLPEDEIEAVADYVVYLSQRGELEEQLAQASIPQKQIKRDYFPGYD